MAIRIPVLGGWLGVDAVRDARERTRDLVRHTPVLTSRSLSDECGGPVLLKAENLQRTGSFKLRGALAKVDRIAAAAAAGPGAAAAAARPGAAAAAARPGAAAAAAGAGAISAAAEPRVAVATVVAGSAGNHAQSLAYAAR